MNKKVIVAIGLDYIKNQLIEAAGNIDFIDILFFDKKKISKSELEYTMDFIKNKAEALMLGNITTDEDINAFYKNLKDEGTEIPMIPIGPPVIESGFFNIDEEVAVKINSYFINGGLKNIISSLYYIAYNYLELNSDEKSQCENSILEPEKLPFDGIFHIGSEGVFDSVNSYINWYLKNGGIKDYKWVGILTHRHNWSSGNIEVENALIREFEDLGFKVIPVFSYASAENMDEIKDFSGVINDYFSVDGEIVIDGLVNLQMLAAVSNSKRGNIFEQGVYTFKEMDIPVFRPLISHMQDEKTWLNNISGLSTEIPWAYTTPEMLGMIEPIIIGCKGETGKTVPIGERVIKFAKRVSKWIKLRNTPNEEKKIALFIHSAPCAGVEATIGMGVGLNVFESVVRILKELKGQGYRVENIPENGQNLHEIIMNRKAYQDFRWTSVEDIVRENGVLYKLSLEEYNKLYNKIHEDVRKEIEDTWGMPPGEGMVHEGKIIITGISFGNVTLMVQPKRGCYGAKCTGEVCKILHDPKCPPPHQYIATYRYVEEIMKANAIVHVGTGGSLEYMPGKTNALSNKCYADVVIGTIPNIYIYNAGIGTEGIAAKRRNYAAIIDYLPAAIEGDVENSKIVNLIGEYIEAVESNSKQSDLFKSELEKRTAQINGAEEIIKSEDSFINGVKKLKDYLIQSINGSKNQVLHILGQIPEVRELVSYIKEYIDSNSKNAEEIKRTLENGYAYNVTIMELIAEIIEGSEIKIEEYKGIEERLLSALKFEVLDIYEKLIMVKHEIENIMRALEGRFIEPGLSGMPCENFKNILPTGRNFYLMDCEKVPTREAYEIGRQLADKLIEKYIEDEAKFPEKVAMNMISTDISMSKGEQLSQILNLMGITPVWNENGRVVDIEAIPAEKLNRPRIDVTVRISGVLRDSYPDAVNLMDRAVLLAASLNESNEDNFVKKNTLEIEKALKELGQNEDIKRRSTIRVFGDKPGTYGSGVDLALKASAWKSEKDIAKLFVYFSSYAYGEKLNGCMAKHEFVENVKGTDISYETTISNRYHILSSSFAASVQGGFGAVNKVLGGKEIKQYHGSAEGKDNLRVSTTEEEIQKVMDETFFNPLWKEGMKKKEYTGASEIMRMLQTIFDWQCLSQNVGDKNVDKLVDLYVNDRKMQEWFNKHNKYAIEEISRRFLELHERGKWNPDIEVLNRLKRSYVKIEGDMEELLENSSGEIQGGETEVINYDDIEDWKNKLKEVEDVFDINR